MGDVVADARAASRADAWRHIEPLVAEVERLRKENTRLTNRNIVLEALGAAAEQTHDEWERLRSVVAGVEALADEMKQRSEASASARVVGEIHYRYFERRLRSVLSDTKGDARVLVSTDPDDDHSRAYEAAVAAREEQRND